MPLFKLLTLQNFQPQSAYVNQEGVGKVRLIHRLQDVRTQLVSDRTPTSSNHIYCYLSAEDVPNLLNRVFARFIVTEHGGPPVSTLV